MLKLHRLEVSGFKSFVDPTTLDFSGGITAIVGPNGCGKSNVCDAVSWVLGERSAKSLRGATMEDVIFNGSSGRKPLGLAEATLTLLTPPDFPGTEDGRLVVSRRIHRSGDGEYFLNGRRVRLKEIRDRLMDTGLGLRTYSVIEQDKVGMILSGKPQERRRLLEEAAGITRYRERKRVAEVKLEEALANLHRLEDILGELERSLRALKRQAGAARRYEERREEHRVLLRRVLLGRWAELQGTLRTLEARVADMSALDAERGAELHRREAGLAEAREGLERLAQALSERHRSQAELAARIEGRQEFLKSSRARLEELRERITGGEAGASRHREEIATRETALAELEEQSRALEDEYRRTADDVDRDADQLAAADRAVAAAEEAIERQRAELMTSLARLNDLRNRRHREQIEGEKGEFRRVRLDEELEARTARLEQATHELAAAEEELALLARRCDETEQALESHEGRRAQLAAERQRLALELAESRESGARMEQRREVLVELSQAHAERRQELEAALSAAGVTSPRFLGEGASAPDGWEPVLDDYLGAWADAVIVPPESDGIELASLLGAGVALVEPAGAAVTSPAEPVDEAVLGGLAEALGLSAELGAALPPAYLVTDADAARRLARSHPGTAFLCRELVARAGVLESPATTARPGQLGRARELAELERRIAGGRAIQERLEQEAGRRDGEIDQAGEARDATAERLDRLRQDRAVGAARLEDARVQHRRLTVERETLATEREEIERELSRIHEASCQFADELETAERAHRELEARFDSHQQAAEAAREQRAALRTDGADHRGRHELAAERLRAQRDSADRVRREIDEAHAQLAAWREEQEALQRRCGELEGAIDVAEAELQSALEARGGAEEEVLGTQESLDEQGRRVRELQEQTEADRAAREAGREVLAEVRVELAGHKQDGDHLAASFTELVGEPLPDVVPEPPEDLPALEADLDRLKQRLESMGPVNLLAAQEYQEQEERHDFLARQRDDVAGSIERLRRTIREINQTSSERFRETFEAVNASFGRIFVELFQGGEAEMRLLDEDDLLESGIEIVARPPGKRPQNLMLLSGGEKALTAIALLFALFRTKPSPFCILDEVDAPLDDVNTLRFVSMLQRMAGETQFVVITHNKLTMEAASRLYGVTMQERGVSSLVAVELDQVQPPIDAADAVASA